MNKPATTQSATLSPAALLEAQPLAIFRAGRQIADDGTVYVFSEADVAASASAYDPALREAPLVLGHPTADGPAMGWVQSCTANGGELSIRSRGVDARFAELVQAERYKKRSACFYPPNHPNNPKPGVWYLRHVGWLGAQQPAVAGLPDAQFADDASGCVRFSENAGTLAYLFRGLRDWFIGQFGVDAADRVLPGYAVEQLEAGARDDDASDGPLFSESTRQPQNPQQKDRKMATPDELQRQLDESRAAERKTAEERDAANAKLATHAQQQRTATHAANVAFAEAQAKAGRVLPKDGAALVAVLDTLADSASVQFGEGDAQKTIAPAEWLRAYVADAKPLVAFGEYAPGGAGNVAGEGLAGLTDEQITERANRYAKEHKVSFSEALDALRSFDA